MCRYTNILACLWLVRTGTTGDLVIRTDCIDIVPLVRVQAAHLIFVWLVRPTFAEGAVAFTVDVLSGFTVLSRTIIPAVSDHLVPRKRSERARIRRYTRLGCAL